MTNDVLRNCLVNALESMKDKAKEMGIPAASNCRRYFS